LTSIVWNKEVFYISIVIGFLVFSHWVLDFIGWSMSVINANAMGVPILFDDAVWIGLGVYTTWFGALVMDIGVFFVGLGIYLRYVMKIKTKKVIDKRSPME